MDKLAGPASIKPNMFTQQRFIRGGSAPWSTLTTLYTILDIKRYPFPIPSIGEWYPFQIPDLERCTLVSCCKCTHRFEI